MKISVFGTGYVGLITGTCLAELGNQVICVDVDQDKIKSLQQGVPTIYEPGLDDLLSRNIAAGRISFTTDSIAAVEHGECQFIAVGTPPDEDGSADLQYVLVVAKTIGQHLKNPCVVINKSTVPIGTAAKVKKIIQECLQERDQSINFAVVSNPEFLKEGAAIQDFMNPDRIVIGADNDWALHQVRQLYAPITDNGFSLLGMDVASAELTKYASNAFLATKISFMNELSRLAETFGANIDTVRRGIGSDSRIGPYFLNTGCGYGGSCFPKDVSALIRMAEEQGVSSQILQAVELVNHQQKQILVKKIKQHFGNDLNGKTFALWGLAFKPNTDDMREASSRVILDLLWQAGANVQAFDPVANNVAKELYPGKAGFTVCEDQYSALNKADALIVVTEWDVFRNPDFDLIKQMLNEPVIFDGRNLFNTERLSDLGIHHYAIGRGKTEHARREPQPETV